MRPWQHLISSFLLALLFFYLTKEPVASFMVFVSGFLLIDLDHFIDFWVYKKRITYSNEFFGKYYNKLGKIYIFFHSFELMFLLGILFYVSDFGIIGIGIMVGMLFHLSLDLLFNDVHPLTYFLIFRILKGFDVRYICNTYS